MPQGVKFLLQGGPLSHVDEFRLVAGGGEHLHQLGRRHAGDAMLQTPHTKIAVSQTDHTARRRGEGTQVRRSGGCFGYSNRPNSFVPWCAP